MSIFQTSPNFCDMFWLTLNSEDEEEEGCWIKLQMFNRSYGLRLPNWILRSHQELTDFDIETNPREYGVTYHKGYLAIYYGVQTLSSDTTKRWSCFLPWTQWRLVKRHLLKIDGVQSYAQLQEGDISLTKAQIKTLTNSCPKLYYQIEDSDRTVISASAYVSQFEMVKGIGYFKWVQYFSKASIYKMLTLDYSAEVGPGKSSYTGGVLSTRIVLAPEESPKMAIFKYCIENKLLFLTFTERPEED